jgi:hypothetical protein
MSSIVIKGWRVQKIEGDDFTYVPPEYHPTYWEVPKWWYKGDRTVYTSCMRVDGPKESTLYLDGITPLMQVTVTWDGDNTLDFSDIRSMTRARICATSDLAAVSAGTSDEYIDIQFTGGELYRVVYDNYFGPDIQEPLQRDVNPEWVNGIGSYPTYTDPIPFITGTYIGGVEPVTYEVRHKELIGKNWVTPTDFSPQTNTPTERTITLDPKTKTTTIHIETKATDADGAVVYNNGPYLDVNNPIPTITADPTLSLRNNYEVGQVLTGYAGDYVGGLPDATARCRWQFRSDVSQSWSGGSWVQDVSFLQEIVSPAVPAGTVQARLQYQIVEPSTDNGTGPRNTNRAAERDIREA